jgi:hypothetical protein
MKQRLQCRDEAATLNAAMKQRLQYCDEAATLNAAMKQRNLGATLRWT